MKFWPFYFQFQAKYSDSTLNIKNLDMSKLEAFADNKLCVILTY